MLQYPLAQGGTVMPYYYVYKYCTVYCYLLWYSFICVDIIGPGLPNALGEYDETPEIMSAHLKVSNWFRIIEL